MNQKKIRLPFDWPKFKRVFEILNERGRSHKQSLSSKRNGSKASSDEVSSIHPVRDTLRFFKLMRRYRKATSNR
jgi:hypothetical protein